LQSMVGLVARQQDTNSCLAAFLEFVSDPARASLRATAAFLTPYRYTSLLHNVSVKSSVCLSVRHGCIVAKR